jgi:hypothetical protein
VRSSWRNSPPMSAPGLSVAGQLAEESNTLSSPTGRSTKRRNQILKIHVRFRGTAEVDRHPSLTASDAIDPKRHRSRDREQGRILVAVRMIKRKMPWELAAIRE